MKEYQRKYRYTYRLLGYGLTVEDFERMLRDQGYECPICCEKVLLVVDHNHKTGDVRGLLCGSCNRGLGAFRDAIENLERAARYLKKYGETK